jgi:hypothetical protein
MISAARLDRAVSKLVAAPFATASSQLTISMRLEPTDGSKETLVKAQYRNERYKNALVSFDMARSLATEDETMVIDLMSWADMYKAPRSLGRSSSAS